MKASLFIQFQLISAQSLKTNIIWSTVINTERTVPAAGVIRWEPFYNILMHRGELFQNIKHFISSQLQDTALEVASLMEKILITKCNTYKLVFMKFSDCHHERASETFV